MIRSALRTLPILAGLVLPVGSLRAESGPIDTSLPAEPTEVSAAIYVIDVIAIDGSMQTFKADIAVRMSWMDPRLAKPGGGVRRISVDDVWHPRMLIANVRQSKTTLPDVVEVEPDGEVTYRQRLIGDFACPLDLRSFPFDEQELFIHMISTGYRPHEVQFLIDSEASGFSERFSITDWQIGDPVTETRNYTLPHSGEQLPGLMLQFEVERLARYYAGTIFATVSIIVAMAWFVFWIPPKHINPRASISVTSMLSLIAYRFVASQDLPRLPYLTKMDFFLLGAALMVLCGLAAVVVIARRETQGEDESALRWNRIMRWAFPLAFGLMMVMLAI